MATIRILQIDAFADKPFTGNPAAVCFLDVEASDAWMQSVAAEMNLSETAFVVPIGDATYRLRWFTPQIEVALCGHATLASAHALWDEGCVASGRTIRFQTLSGELQCSQQGGPIQMDFPATPVLEDGLSPDVSAALSEALGIDAVAVGRTKFDVLLVVESEGVLRSLVPDFRKLPEIAMRGLIVTCRSDDKRFDFVSRYFAPAAGIDEDPVTGSAHCCLGPYWSAEIGKQELVGYQASSRGGIVHVHVAGDRVLIGGHAVTIMRGSLMIGG